MMFTDFSSTAVCIMEEEAGRPWRCWAGDRTVSDGLGAELFGMRYRDSAAPHSTVFSLSSMIKYEGMHIF